MHLLQMLDRVQHRFIPGKSCATQLVGIVDYICSLLESGKQTDVVVICLKFNILLSLLDCGNLTFVLVC
jgi:hypothetical protein